MKRRGKRVSPVGCLVAIALCGMVMLVLPRAGRPSSTPVSDQQVVKLPSATMVPVTQLASPTLIVPITERPLTPLEVDVSGLVGVRAVRSVVSVDGIVYMEIEVQQGYAAQPFAEALLEVARRHGTVLDFSTMLNDGAGVPVSFLWRNGAWNGAQMIQQQATFVSITAQPAVNTARPTRTPQPTAVYVAPPAAGQVRPGNCATAVAMGLSEVDAARWDHLDADNDGVACYGN